MSWEAEARRGWGLSAHEPEAIPEAKFEAVRGPTGHLARGGAQIEPALVSSRCSLVGEASSVTLAPHASAGTGGAGGEGVGGGGGSGQRALNCVGGER